VLSHTLAAVLCCDHDLGLLNFNRLLTD
jgi:hypothetical protein